MWTPAASSWAKSTCAPHRGTSTCATRRRARGPTSSRKSSTARRKRPGSPCLTPQGPLSVCRYLEKGSSRPLLSAGPSSATVGNRACSSGSSTSSVVTRTAWRARTCYTTPAATCSSLVERRLKTRTASCATESTIWIRRFQARAMVSASVGSRAERCRLRERQVGARWVEARCMRGEGGPSTFGFSCQDPPCRAGWLAWGRLQLL
mmetsp:Transcript_91705/g.258916  ORF Transcript_91705/g.258916 Transcript_91705/m.258916 type:complete len:206 (-) Transcript_91705:105-722(-)